MAKTMQELRKEKGYRSAREFADALGISPSSMSRYVNQPDTIPVKVAWSMADALDCSIDEIVGRADVSKGASELQGIYSSLLPENRYLLDDFVNFVKQKDEKMRIERELDANHRSDELCRFYELMFLHSLYDTTEFGMIVSFESREDERAAFKAFVDTEAANKRRAKIDDHCARLEKTLRNDAAQSDDEEIGNALEEVRDQLGSQLEKNDEEVIQEIMKAYDRLHAGETYSSACSAMLHL